MWQAEVLTEWLFEDGTNRPRLTKDYRLVSAVDTTGQPVENLVPDPNQSIWYIVCEEAMLDLIEADNNYLVLWAKEVIEEENRTDEVAFVEDEYGEIKA